MPSWIRMDHGVHDHPKIVEASTALGITREQFVGHMTRLWIWCTKYRTSGSLTGLTPEQLAEASGWRGDPYEWIRVLHSVRLVDRTRRTFCVHGWLKRNDYYHREKARKTQEARKRRARVSTERRAPTQRNVTNETKDPPTPRATRGRVPVSPATRTEVDAYAALTGWRATDATYRSAQRILDAGQGERLMRAREGYAAEIEDRATPREFRIQPHNWYGRAARWKSYENRAVEVVVNDRPEPFENRLLTPEEKARMKGGAR